MMTTYQWRFLLFALAVVAMFILTTKAALPTTIACQHSGRTWRLVDGKRCWAAKYYPKSALAWAPIRRRHDERPHSGLQPSRDRYSSPVASRLVGPTRAAADAQSATQTPPIPVPQVAQGSLALALAAKAGELRESLPVTNFGQPMRTRLANPAPQPQATPTLVPRPRPRPPPPPHPAPPWLALLLTTLLLGNAATQRED